MTSRTVCDRCGQVHERCSSHRRDGQPCAKWANKGQTVCRNHGGSTPQAKRAAKRRIALAEAQATLGLPRDVDPSVALLEEVHRTAGHVAWLQTKVHELDETTLVWGRTELREKTGGEDWGTTDTAKAQPSVWYELYAQERKHLTDVCKAAIAAGIEERRVRLAESQGELLAGAIRRILADLDLTVEQQQKVPQVVPRHLRALSS